MSAVSGQPLTIYRPGRLRRATACVLLIAAAGCAPEMDDLRHYVETTKDKYEGSVEPLPQFEPYQNYVYNAFERRPPFTEPTSGRELEEQAADGNGITPDTDRRKEPLEFFPLDSLDMVGTIERQGEMWALVQDSEGTIHRVQPGNHAGQNYGEIVRITETRIDLLEIIPDGLGSWVEREISLELGE